MSKPTPYRSFEITIAVSIALLSDEFARQSGIKNLFELLSYHHKITEGEDLVMVTFKDPLGSFPEFVDKLESRVHKNAAEAGLRAVIQKAKSTHC